MPLKILTNGIHQSHLRIARRGDIIDGVTVSDTVMPDYSPTSNWTKLSEAITTLKITPIVGTVVPVVKIVGGRKVLRRNIRQGPASLEITFTQQDESEITQELLMLSGKIDTSAVAAVNDSASFVPLSGSLDGVSGWFHLQQYNDANELVRYYLFWGELTLADGLTSGEAVTAPQLKLTVMENALNDGRMLKPSPL